jgi:hypothetical protein
MGKYPKLRAMALAVLVLLGTALVLAGVQVRSQRALTAAALVEDDPEDPRWTPPADGLTVAVTGPAGTVCTLLDRDGAALWVLRLDEDGLAETPRLSPGDYTLQFRDGARADFSLRDNGSLTAQAGDAGLWTDGEVLHLATAPTGVITVTKRLPADGWDGLDPTFLFQLADDTGQQWQQVLGFYADLTPEDGWYSLTATFSGLPAGTYTLTETSLQEDASTVTLDGQPVTLPAAIVLSQDRWTADVVSTAG